MQQDKRKLNSILLVDDDDITIFYNTRVIQKLDVAHHIHAELNGEQALRYLMEKENHAPDYRDPDLILLDINMPLMNGFEFLEAYDQLPLSDAERVTIFMLTSSTLDEDRLKAERYRCVAGFLPKPLQADTVLEIIQQHFESSTGN